MQEPTIIYEQPLNEHMRACLRLEHLFKRFQVCVDQIDEWSCQSAMEALLEILTVVDRPDIKSKFFKALAQHAALLNQLETKPQVDKAVLHTILMELEPLLDMLYHSQDKIGHELRNNPFLNTIRLHMANPGGASPFAIPAYYLWLRKPIEQCYQDLKAWYQGFEQLQAVVKLLLQLTRGSVNPQTVIANAGFYQQGLDARAVYQLIQVVVPIDQQVYPEISAGKHRLSVRFFNLNLQQRSLQTLTDVQFKIACCAL